MPKNSSVYICQQCGYQSPTFLGRCPECDAWGTLVESIMSSPKGLNSKLRVTTHSEIIDLSSLKEQKFDRVSTKIEEFDRVLGGGIVKGSIILVSGDPGIGKSTLLTQLALNIQASGTRQQTLGKDETSASSPEPNSCLYVAGEESAQQIKIRVDRIKLNSPLKVLNEVDVDIISGVIEREKPSLVIVDSIQTLETSELESAAGSVSQVRESAHRLQHLSKRLHIPIILVGHVTKEGTVAGPRTLEHLVDVVLSLEGDEASFYRILRSSKNRFGPTDEVGIFEMIESGLIEVKNPSMLFLENRIKAPGSVVTATMNGQRPIMVEIQALVTKSYLPSPRRTGAGVDYNRLQLLVAVLQKRLNLPLYDQDIFVNVTGGLKVSETASDLAICLSIVSSLKDKNIADKTIFVGEVGLLGELRPVKNLDRRFSEAKKLGFDTMISPQNAKTLAEVAKSVLK